MRPAPVVDEEPRYDIRAGDVCLTIEETEKLRKACKAHATSVTHFLTVLAIVAEVDWVLTIAQSMDESYDKNAIAAYADATDIMSAWNIIDQVCLSHQIIRNLPDLYLYRMERIHMREYARHGSTKGSPTVTVDGFPLKFDMEAVRKVVKYDKATGKIERNASEEVFWTGLVMKSKELWNSIDVCLLPSTKASTDDRLYRHRYQHTLDERTCIMLLSGHSTLRLTQLRCSPFPRTVT